jgi:hypothetical protein
MPNSTTNPPVEIAIPAWTVATPSGVPVATSTVTTQTYKYHMSRVFATGSFVTSGVKYFNGGTAVKVRAVLCDAGGTILASSPLAAVTNTAGSENTLAWSTPYAVTGPCALFIGLQVELGGTGTLVTISTTVLTNQGFLGNVSPDASLGSFALPASGVITVPTTYAVNLAPLVSLY